MSTYFVTGASGFIGRHLCTRLRAEGHTVRALVRQKSHPYLEKLGVELVQGDLLAPEAYASSITGSDVVIHLAAEAGYGFGTRFQGVNVDGTRKLLEVVERAEPGLKRFVYVSSISAIERSKDDPCRKPIDESTPANPASDYGRSKASAERIVKNSSLWWTIVRPALVVGEGMRPQSHVASFVRASLRRSFLSRFDLPGRVSVLHVDDLVDALLLVSTHPQAHHKAFLAAGDPIALGEIFRLARPGAASVSLDWAARLAAKMVHWIPTQAKAVFFDAFVASDAQLRSLGWTPKHDPVGSVREVVASVRRDVDARVAVAGYCLITQAGGEVGSALAQHLSKLGRRLILVDRDAERLSKVLPGVEGVLRHSCDFSHEEDVRQLLSQAFWTSEQVDEIYHCGLQATTGKVFEVAGDLQADVFNANILSGIRLLQRAVGLMVMRRFGRVVLIGSDLALRPRPGRAAYSAASAALLSYGGALSGELDNTGVRVVNICLSDPVPKDVAARLLQSLSTDAGCIYLGGRAWALNFGARLLPRAWNIKFAARS